MSKSVQKPLVETFKRLQNRYRLTVLNDDTFEEVITFKLTRLSVYVAMSSIFVFLVSCTIALIVLTPIKYYIPGFNSGKSKAELQVLKLRTDSLENEIRYKDKYLLSIKTALEGNTQALKDTQALVIPNIPLSNE